MQNVPVILKPSKIKSIILMLISIGFVSLGISLLERNIMIAVLNIIFFGMTMIIFIINLIPNSVYLKIDEKGIEMKNLFRITFIPWQAVSNFTVKDLFFKKMVMYHISEKLLSGKEKRPKEAGFPDTYGMSAQKLAAMLNEYKNYFSEK